MTGKLYQNWYQNVLGCKTRKKTTLKIKTAKLNQAIDSVALEIGIWSLWKRNVMGNIDLLHPLATSVPHHLETSQLICRANQLTDFYMIGNISR